MKELVLYALVLLTTVAVCRSGSTTEQWKSKLNDLSEPAQQVVRETASSMKDYVLGPDNKETQYCTDHSCDIPGSTILKPEAAPPLENSDEDGLVVVPDDGSSPQHWNVFSTIQDTLTSVKDSIQYTVYKKTTQFANSVYNTVHEFSEKVRSVFREEFNNFLELLWEKGIGTDPASDSLFRRFRDALVHKILVIGLFISCLLLNYIFWHLYLSIFFILAFNCSIILTYKVMGPLWIYSAFLWCMGYTWYFLTFIWTYPYISAFCIVVMFIAGICWRIYVCYKEYERAERKKNMESTIQSMNTRLQKMEEQQKEILRLLKDLHERSMSESS